MSVAAKGFGAATDTRPERMGPINHAAHVGEWVGGFGSFSAAVVGGEVAVAVGKLVFVRRESVPVRCDDSVPFQAPPGPPRSGPRR